jgi:hypothetical protein
MQNELAFNHSMLYCLRMANLPTFRPLPHLSDETNEIMRKAYENAQVYYQDRELVQAYMVGALALQLDLLIKSKNQ